MSEKAFVVDSFLATAFIGTSLIFLTGVVILTSAASAWFFRRALRRSEKRLTERLAQQIHDEIAGLEQIRADCAVEQVGDDLSGDELELTELANDEFPKKRVELPAHAAQVGVNRSIEENLSSMGRIIRAEKENQRSEEQLAERLAQQIHNEIAGSEQRRTDCVAKQVGDDLSEQMLELTDEDPSTEEILSSMRRIIRAENA